MQECKDISIYMYMITFFMLNVTVNNFSVMLGRSYRFLVIASTLGGGGKYVLLKNTTRRPEWGSNPRPLDPESKVLTTRPSPPPPAAPPEHMSRVIRKPTFYICENKDADQLHEADQPLCFRYIDSTIPLLSKSEISSL